MRILCLLLLIFVSQHSFAAWQRAYGFATNQQCITYMTNTLAPANPNKPYKCVGGDLMEDSVLCPTPKTYNLISQSCSTACGTDAINNFTSAGQGFVSCIGDCEVAQIGSATCQGVGTNPDSYCTANYQKTGKYCPDVAKQTNPCTTCGASSSSIASSSVAQSSVASSVAVSSVPTSSPSASSAAATSSGSGAVSSTSGGGSGSGGEGGEGGGSGGTGSGSASSAGAGTGSGGGSVSGGGSCDTPPVCSGDALQCNLILQTYKLRCNSVALHSRESVEPTIDLEQKLVEAKQQFTDQFNIVKTQLSSSLALSISGGAGSLPSNIQIIKGQPVELGIVARADFFGLIGALFMFSASILSAYIILQR